MPLPKPKTKGDFFNLERATWNELNALMRGLPRAAWTTTGAAGDWSPKDVWAHIGDWMKEAQRVVPLILRDAKFNLDIQTFNAEHYRRNQKLTVAQARARAQSERKKVLALGRRLKEEQLLGNGRVYSWMSFSTFNHYHEHIPTLARFRRAVLRQARAEKKKPRA